MKSTMTLSAIASMLLHVAVALAAGPSAAPPAPQTTAPSGDYQVAWLTLAKAWDDGRDLPLFVGLRGGRGAQVWFCAPQRRDCHRMWIDADTLKLAGGKLSGEVGGRMVKIWAPIAHVGDYVFSLDAAVEGGKMTGTYTATFTPTAQAGPGAKQQTVKGALAGQIATGAELAKRDAMAAGKDWPGYYGVDFAFRGPDCGAKMIDDLAACRPLWKAEESLPCMWGKGPDGRYKVRACVVGVDGGASSPVVAGGMAYCFYFRPVGPVADEPRLRQEAAKFTPSAPAQQAYVDWHRPLADDVVVGIDAATGRTAWRTVLPGRAINLQTHKWRGYNPVPFVAGGVVYVVDFTNRLYALDAASGRLLWEYPKAAAKRFTASATGPIVADGVAVASLGGQAVGLDARSGKELWKAPGGNLLVWQKGAVRRVIVTGGIVGKPGMIVSCLEPKTGKVAWRAETPMWGAGDVYPILDGDRLVSCVPVKGDKPGEADFGRDSQVVCYRLTDDGLEKAWAVPAPYPAVDKYALAIAGGHVYVDGSGETFCLKLDTGEKMGTAKAGGARTQMMFAADGRLFIQPEGRHGGQSFYMLDAAPAGFRVLGAGGTAATNHPGAGQWVPPHPPDTAYANQPVSYPLVDGRLFVRGHDGLYCYDLRAR